MSFANNLLESLGKAFTLNTNQESSVRLQVLLTDFIVSARAGKVERGTSVTHSFNIGGQLAINASLLDTDDIDWSVMTHPGSIIWAALLESIILNPHNAEYFSLAARAGYRTSASIANFFGPNHRKNWHVTTTAGALAAASTSSIYGNLSESQHISALGSAASNMGGIALADRRSGGAVFNRASATSLGLLATNYAANHLPSDLKIWEGDRGLLELFSISDHQTEILDGVSTSSLRLFPYNGFIQSLVYAITELANNLKGELVEINIGVNTITSEIVNGSVGGNYWDLRHGAASAWQSKDLTRCVEATSDVLTKINVEAIDIPVSGVEVSLKTTEGIGFIRIEDAPGSKFGTPEHKSWQFAKWKRLVGEEIFIAEEFSSVLLSDRADAKTITSLREFLL